MTMKKPAYTASQLTTRLHERLRNVKGYDGLCRATLSGFYDKGSRLYFCELHFWQTKRHRHTIEQATDTEQEAVETAFKELENMLVNAEIREERQELKRYAALQTTNHKRNKAA